MIYGVQLGKGYRLLVACKHASGNSGSEFVVANTLAKWKGCSQIKLLYLAKVLARKQYQKVFLYLTLCPHLLSTENLCK